MDGNIPDHEKSFEKYISAGVFKEQQFLDDCEFIQCQILQKQQMVQSQILPSSQFPKQQNRSTVNSKKEKSKNATAKYRQKRKEYLKELEENVKSLQEQISQAEIQIQKYKDQILLKLEANKMNGQGNENAQIFTQLTELVEKSSVDVDIDKINLLLDTLKYRIGSSGKERQAKINYFFKTIVNTLFPALHRYFFSIAQKSEDLFSEDEHENHLIWTKELYEKIQLSSSQRRSLGKYQENLKRVNEKCSEFIRNLNSLKDRLKEEEIVVDNIEDIFRECMTPVQCGRWTIFCEKHKYKDELFLDKKFFPKNNKYEQKAEQTLEERIKNGKYGRKMVKKDN